MKTRLSPGKKRAGIVKLIRFVPLGCIGILLFLSVDACRKDSAQAAQSTETYVSDPNSVGFDISAYPGKDATRRWNATYSERGKTARFIIQLDLSKQMEPEAGLQISSGHGFIAAEEGSDASTMLVALAKALEAKKVPQKVQRASRLPFTYVILGEHNVQAKDGGFSPGPGGNWTAMKIFVGEGQDEGEVFLNFNPVTGKAQFSIKDPDYGDIVVGKLATVL